MTDILTDFSQQSMAGTIESNLIEYSFYLAKSEYSEIFDGEDVKWVRSGRPVFNRILNAQFAPDQLSGRIVETLARFKAARVPVTWLTGPTTTPARLGRNLTEHGFTYRGEWSGMALNLESLARPARARAELVIEEATGPALVALWAKTACSGFLFPPAVSRAYYDLFQNLPSNQPSAWRPYLAFQGDTPVATCALFMGAGVAGIYWTSTIPGKRHQGIARTLTYELLQEATRHGYRIAVLHATQEGRPLYRRLGFEEYCKIGIYTSDPRSKLVQLGQKVNNRVASLRRSRP